MKKYYCILNKFVYLHKLKRSYGVYIIEQTAFLLVLSGYFIKKVNYYVILI